MHRASAQSAEWPSACGSETILHFPVHLCGTLQIRGLQLRGSFEPVLWLADWAAITR